MRLEEIQRSGTDSNVSTSDPGMTRESKLPWHGSPDSMDLDSWAGFDALTDALRQSARALLDPMGRVPGKKAKQ
jgi:hypothetical protein